jgi:hypothetical protein
VSVSKRSDAENVNRRHSKLRSINE